MALALTVRPAEPRDHALFARFLHELGIDDPTPEPERWQAAMMPHTFFLLSRDVPVGYAFVEVFGARGYVRHVVVDPEWRGRGVGRALMETIARRLRGAGCTRWELNVKRENATAIRLYERVGMSLAYSTHVVRIDWNAVPSLPSAARELASLEVEPAADSRIERQFRLPEGKIERLRSIAGDALVELRDDDDGIAGFARFDPNFPGAYPFRVTDERHARPLLEALARVRRPDLEWIQLVIEDDAATARVLFEAGARPVMELLHMAGDLPRE